MAYLYDVGSVAWHIRSTHGTSRSTHGTCTRPDIQLDAPLHESIPKLVTLCHTELRRSEDPVIICQDEIRAGDAQQHGTSLRVNPAYVGMSGASQNPVHARFPGTANIVFCKVLSESRSNIFSVTSPVRSYQLSPSTLQKSVCSVQTRTSHASQAPAHSATVTWSNERYERRSDGHAWVQSLALSRRCARGTR